MKKLLLSSIIMFGICGFVTAQNAQDAKLIKSAVKTNSISPAPQKAAVLDENATAEVAADKAPSDLQADKAPVNSAEADRYNKKKAAKAAVVVGDDGVVVDAEVAKKAEMRKAEAAADKKKKDN